VAYDGGSTEPAARQSHAPSFHRANVVATRPATVVATGTLTGPRVAAHLVAADRALDIDTAADLRLAEALLHVLDPAPVPPAPVEGANP
jgi:CMP-N-acetylneuraminic acid synthetase